MDHERVFDIVEPKESAGGADRHFKHIAGNERLKRLKSNGDWG